jgi:hypothetical protein
MWISPPLVQLDAAGNANSQVLCVSLRPFFRIGAQPVKQTRGENRLLHPQDQRPVAICEDLYKTSFIEKYVYEGNAYEQSAFDEADERAHPLVQLKNVVKVSSRKLGA